MLFVTVLKAHPGTLAEMAARRLQWKYPEGVKPVAEYWLQTDEADHVHHIMALRMDWDDLFDMQTFPTVTAEEGIETLKQTMPS